MTDERPRGVPTLRQWVTLVGVLLLVVVPTGAIVVNQLDAIGDDGDVVLAPYDGPNGAYASVDAANELTVNVTERGVNPDAVTDVGRVFTVTNVGNDSKRVWLTQTNRRAVTVYAETTGQPIGRDANVTLHPGDRVVVGLRIDTTGAAVEPRTTLVTKLIFHVQSVEPTPPPALDAPDALDFGTVRVGANATAALVVRNVGDVPLQLRDVSVAGLDPGAFERATAGPLPDVAAGESVTVPLRFAPTRDGPHAARVTVRTTDAAQSVTTTLRGVGVVPKLTVVGDAAVAFGDVAVGETARETVVLANTGTAPVTLTRVTVAPDDAGVGLAADYPVTLAPGERHAVTVTFAPTTPGDATATVTVASTALNAPLAVPVTGRGIAPDVHVAPSPVAFPQVGTGLAVTRPVTVTNRGTAPLVLTDVRVHGPGSEMFAVDALAAPVTLAPNESRLVAVTFRPTDAGAFAPSLVVRSTDPDEPRASVALHGTGLPPHIDVSTDHVNFGDVPVGGSKTLTVTISNPGDPATDLHVTETRLLGNAAGAFEIVDGDAPFTLAPNESKQITVRYAPQTHGIKTAQLRILSDAAEAQVDVWMSNTGWRIRVQQVRANDPGVDGDDEPWRTGAARDDAARAELDANDVPPGVGLTVDVSVPSTRAQPATIETVTVRPVTDVEATATFDMNFIHHPTAPPLLAGVDHAPPAGRRVTEHFAIEHSIPNDQLAETRFTFSVKKTALPAGTDPGAVTVLRYANGAWTDIGAAHTGETATSYVYHVDSPGFSQFVVTAPDAEDAGDGDGDGKGDGGSGGAGPNPGDGDGTSGDGGDSDADGDSNPDESAPTVARGDTSITFEGAVDDPALVDLVTVEELGVPPVDRGGRSGPAARISQGQTVSPNGERIDVTGDISLTISGTDRASRDLDLKGADALATVGEPITLVGSHSLFQSKDAIDDDWRMIHRVEISVPAKYENRSAVLRLRLPRDRFGTTSPEDATVARNHGGWQLLETTVESETPEYVVLRAYTPGFSEFAVFADNDVAYEWTVQGTDAPLSGRQIQPRFDAVGFYDATLTVTDAFGLTDTARYVILVNDVPAVAVQRPAGIAPNQTVTLVAEVTDDMGNVTVAWTFPDGTTATGRVVERRFAEGSHAVRVVATDEFGASATANETLFVSGSVVVREAQKRPAASALLVLLALAALLLALRRLRRGSRWLAAPGRRHPPVVETFERPVVDRAAHRVVIPALRVVDRGDDLADVSVAVTDDRGRDVGRETGDVDGGGTYEGTGVVVSIDDAAALRPDTRYAVELRVRDDAGAETVERRSVRTDPFIYPYDRRRGDDPDAAILRRPPRRT